MAAQRWTGTHAFLSLSCYEARPGVPMTTLAGIGQYLRICIYPENSSRDSPDYGADRATEPIPAAHGTFGHRFAARSRW